MFHAPEIQVAHPWGITDYNATLEVSVNMFINGTYPLEKMVTHRIPFENIDQGFQWLITKVPGYVKGIVTF